MENQPKTQRYRYALGLATLTYAETHNTTQTAAHAELCTWTARRLYTYLRGLGWRYWTLYGRWIRQ